MCYDLRLLCDCGWAGAGRGGAAPVRRALSVLLHTECPFSVVPRRCAGPGQARPGVEKNVSIRLFCLFLIFVTILGFFVCECGGAEAVQASSEESSV